jgi:hypothetical protein
MAIKEELLELVTKHIDEKIGGTLQCPLCSTDNWEFVGIASAESIVAGTFLSGYPGQVYLAKHMEAKLACAHCGNVVGLLTSKIDGLHDRMNEVAMEEGYG